MKTTSGCVAMALLFVFSTAFGQTAINQSHAEISSLHSGQISYINHADRFDCFITHANGEKQFIYSVSEIYYGREELRRSALVDMHSMHDGEIVYYAQDDLTLSLMSSEKGLRHNLYLISRPIGDGNLRVRIPVSSPYALSDIPKGIQFVDLNDQTTALELTNLMIWDANHHPVPVIMHAFTEEGVRGWEIIVDDRRAIYPITIDPLSHDPVWRAIGNYNDELGIVVRGPGDINGDGYDDVLVSGVASGAISDNEGKVNLFFGSPDGPSETPDWEFIGGQGNARLGESLTAGDVNGDGYMDIFSGSPSYSTYKVGDGVVFGHYSTPDGPLPDPDWFATSYVSYSEFGCKADASGDMNNDGYNDLVVAAYGLQKIYIYLGSAEGLPWTPSDSITKPYPGSTEFGMYMFVANINGDAYSDVVVRNTDPVNNTPSVLVFYGSAAGVSHTVSASSGAANDIYAIFPAGDVNNDGKDDIMANQTEFTHLYLGATAGIVETCWSYVTSESNYSQSVYTAGDVNADGFGDVLLYSQYCLNYITPPAGTDVGSTLMLFLGNEGGLSDFPAWWDATTYITNVNSEYVYAASTAGDVNGDGFDDFLIGNPWRTHGGFHEGDVELYYGDQLEYDLILNEDIYYRGNINYERFASVFTPLGDINDDGLDDVAIGTAKYASPYIEQGKVEVFLGDPYGLNMIPVWSYVGPNAYADAGTTICAPGDVTGDGFEDLLIFESFRTGLTLDCGYVMLFKGTASGFEATPARTWSGTFLSGFFGLTTKGIGDVNGDGINDFAISEKGYDGGQTDEGRVLVFYGASPLPPLTPSWTFENNIAYQLLDRIAGAGDINNDGYDDLLIGSPTFSGAFGGGIAYAFYGSPSGLPATPSWQRAGLLSGEYYCDNIAHMGDLNGDGYGDIAIGSGENVYGVIEAARYIDFFYGSAAGIPLAPSFTIFDDTTFALQRDPTPIGDYNGDGYPDFIITSYSQFDNIDYANFPRTSMHYVYSGSPDGVLPQKLLLTNPYDNNGGTNYIIYAAGDVNGDGFSDFVSTAPDMDERMFNNCPVNLPLTDPGTLYLFLGKANACTTASSPTLISATATTLNIQWLSDIHADYTFIRYRKVGTPTWTLDSTSMSTYTISGLLSCSSYEVQVQTFCSDGAADWSPLATFITTGCVTCAVPTGLTSTVISPVKVNVSWTAVPGATKYKISYRPSGGGAWININSTTTTKSINGLTPGTTYQWKVKTICGAFSSAFSPIQYFTTPLRESDDVTSEPALLVYPNPAVQRFSVSINGLDAGAITIELYASNGDLAYTQQHTGGTAGYILIEPHLPAGLYLLRVHDAAMALSAKLILE